ncbi:MAG: TetR/AcrR family transcriptional regulator [Bacteroidetes bacterium]|nr:TetR/AcrR family transcriptional regulator [Bacteroidota bacterium]
MRRKSGDKERSIAEAAVKVFARDGYHGAKITDIAEVAGVATGSVYLYFHNKESILHHLFTQLWKGMNGALAELLARNDLGAREKVEELIDTIFGLFAPNPSLALLFVNEQPQLLREGSGEFMHYYIEFLRMGEQVVRQGIAAGEFDASVDARLFTNYVFGAIRQVLHQWARAPRQFPLAAVRKEVRHITLHGLLPR